MHVIDPFHEPALWLAKSRVQYADQTSEGRYERSYDRPRYSYNVRGALVLSEARGHLSQRRRGEGAIGHDELTNR